MVSKFDFARLCALASLREITFSNEPFHAKARSRKEQPQSKTLPRLAITFVTSSLCGKSLAGSLKSSRRKRRELLLARFQFRQLVAKLRQVLIGGIDLRQLVHRLFRILTITRLE